MKAALAVCVIVDIVPRSLNSLEYNILKWSVLGRLCQALMFIKSVFFSLLF